MSNLDPQTVAGFGEEWSSFDQAALSDAEHAALFERYFAIFPWEQLPAAAEGFDAGCGSGRWARRVAPRVGRLHCVDASPAALGVARRNLANAPSVEFHAASVDAMPFPDGSMDFGYSLGVLHHLPEPRAGLASCVEKLKPGAPFLVYLYYALEGRPAWFRALWRASDVVRRGVSALPGRLRALVCDAIAWTVYWPLARTAAGLERLGVRVDGLPLASYRSASVYTLRTDARDRFGTRLEHRFDRAEIAALMEDAGLENVVFSDRVPYWCAVGTRRQPSGRSSAAAISSGESPASRSTSAPSAPSAGAGRSPGIG